MAVAATGTVFATAGVVVALAGNPLQSPRQGISQNLPVVRGGVTLGTVGLGGVGSGSAVRASYGDWLLESAQVRLVIGGDGRGTERELRRGAIIDLTLRDFAQDQLVDFRTAAEIAGSEARLSMETVRSGPRCSAAHAPGAPAVARRPAAARNRHCDRSGSRLDRAGDPIHEQFG